MRVVTVAGMTMVACMPPAIGLHPACVSARPAVPASIVPGAPTVVGRIRDSRLPEISGIAASRTRPDVWWVHNDSGDKPRVLAINAAGVVLGEVALTGALALDWEDIAIGPGGRSSAPMVYVADIGDNKRLRPSIQLYRFDEPAAGVTSTRPEQITLRYPDGQARDAESLAIDPVSGAAYIFSKVKGASEVFVASRELLESGGGVLQPLGSLAIGPKATGADIAPDGSSVVVRTYEGAYLFERAAGQSLADALRNPPRRFDVPQSEAIAYSADGRYLLSVAEGVGQDIWRVPLG